jgi:hypothetical protein
VAPRVLAEVLGSFPVADFIARIWGKEFLHVPGDPGRYAGLLPWHVLNRVLCEHRLEPPRLRLEQYGAPATSLTFIQHETSRRGERIPRIDFERLYRLLRGGATLVLDSVHEVYSPLGDLVEHLTGLFQARVQVNLYAAFGSSQGFNVHWDDHDVMVLQVDGRKDWRIYGTTRQAPLYRDCAEPPMPEPQPIRELTLSAGDFLYLPRGCWHDAIGRGEPTLHLTVGFYEPTGIDLFHALVDECCDLSAFRVNLPRFGAIDERQEHAVNLAAEFSVRTTADSIDRFIERRSLYLRPRPRSWLPRAALATQRLESETQLRLRDPGPLNVVYTASATECLVYSRGREWRFAAVARPHIEVLSTGKPVALAVLRGLTVEVSPAAVDGLVNILLDEGFLTVVDEP